MHVTLQIAHTYSTRKCVGGGRKERVRARKEEDSAQAFPSLPPQVRPSVGWGELSRNRQLTLPERGERGRQRTPRARRRRRRRRRRGENVDGRTTDVLLQEVRIQYYLSDMEYLAAQKLSCKLLSGRYWLKVLVHKMQLLENELTSLDTTRTAPAPGRTDGLHLAAEQSGGGAIEVEDGRPVARSPSVRPPCRPPQSAPAIA